MFPLAADLPPPLGPSQSARMSFRFELLHTFLLGTVNSPRNGQVPLVRDQQDTIQRQSRTLRQQAPEFISRVNCRPSNLSVRLYHEESEPLDRSTLQGDYTIGSVCFGRPSHQRRLVQPLDRSRQADLLGVVPTDHGDGSLSAVHKYLLNTFPDADNEQLHKAGDRVSASIKLFYALTKQAREFASYPGTFCLSIVFLGAGD